jgi:hypothetical protein
VKTREAKTAFDAGDLDKCEELTTEAEGYEAQIKALDRLTTLEQSHEEKPEATPKAMLTVVADEEDKKAAVTTWGLGDFCKALANNPESVRAYGSELPGYYDVGKAVGPKLVSSVTQAKAIHQKAISGMSESVPAAGGFLVGVQEDFGIMSKGSVSKRTLAL